MKRLFMLFMLLTFAISSQAVVAVNSDWANQFKKQNEFQQLTPEMVDMSLEKFKEKLNEI